MHQTRSNFTPSTMSSAMSGSDFKSPVLGLERALDSGDSARADAFVRWWKTEGWKEVQREVRNEITLSGESIGLSGGMTHRPLNLLFCTGNARIVGMWLYLKNKCVH